MVKKLHLYIVREMIYPLIFSFAFFMFIFLVDKVGDLIDLFLNKGVNLPTVLTLLTYIMPAFIAISVPMGFLVAVIFAFSRLSGDNEITAIRSAGVNLTTLFIPTLLFSIIIAAGLVKFNDSVLPRANYAYKQLIYNIIKQKAAALITPKSFMKDFPNLKIYVEEYNKKTDELKDVMIIRRSKHNRLFIISAHTGKLIKDKAAQNLFLLLKDGDIHISESENLDFLTVIHFSTYKLLLQAGNLSRRIVSKDFREMTFKEMLTKIKSTPKGNSRYRRLLIEYHKKISIPIACIVFVFVGMPLGIYNRRAGKGVSLSLATLLIFVYYILLMFGQSTGEKGYMNPVLAIWLPNIVLFIVGLWMTYKIMRK